jgi:hypothetical protein
MSLISYVKTTTNKRYLYPRIAVIRIDVHPAGENLINMSHDFYARFTYNPKTYISHAPRRQPFASPHKDKAGPYNRKKS